ncbi:MAG: RecQ family ATP-dependent DNA helicase [Pleurocapsa sp.]
MTIEDVFKQVWGYDSFRYPQKEIIHSLLSHKDALVVMPTGGGKSICFQLPALLTEGLTLVISPLVALMENQVSQLQQLNLPGGLLHGELSRSQRKQTLSAIARQELRLLYLSPETLLSPSVWQMIAAPEMEIAGLILDEAHCLVQWGTTFRPTYRRLGAVRRSLLQHKPPGTKIAIAAFTATADPQTQRAIAQTLELQQPVTFIVDPYRSNLSLNIQTVWTPKGRKQQTLKFIQARKQQSGLVYVRSRQDSETLATWFTSLNYRAAAYHAGLVTSARRQIERDWLTGKIQFVICTSAFGMGIDKSNCYFVVHFHPPELLAEYIQEVGRAGRNGQPADALTLISEPTGWLNPEDRQRSQFFTNQLQKQYRQAQALARQIPATGNIETISNNFPHGAIALGVLQSLGLIYWQDPFHYCKQSNSTSLRDLTLTQQVWQRQMQQYLRTKQCRWQFLLSAFGTSDRPANFRCGNCDNCRKFEFKKFHKDLK